MKKYIFLVILFIILYSLFIRLVKIEVEEYSEIIVSSVFSFSFLSAFFIARQNERYSKILETISATDGMFSL